MTSFQNTFFSAIKKKQQSVQAKKAWVHRCLSLSLSLSCFFSSSSLSEFLSLAIVYLFSLSVSSLFFCLCLIKFSALLFCILFYHCECVFKSTFYHTFDTTQDSLFVVFFSVRHHTHTPRTHARTPTPTLAQTHALFCGNTHALLWVKGWKVRYKIIIIARQRSDFESMTLLSKDTNQLISNTLSARKTDFYQFFLSLSLHSKLFFWPPPPFQLLFATSFFSLNTTERHYYRWQKELFWDRYEENRTVPLSPPSHVFCYFLWLGSNWMKIPPHTHTRPRDIPQNYSFFSRCVSWLFKYLGGKERRRWKKRKKSHFLLRLRGFLSPSS